VRLPGTLRETSQPRGMCAADSPFLSEDLMDTRGGMTEEEARGFHGYFILGFLGFTAVAVGAHVMAWMWRPWL